MHESLARWSRGQRDSEKPRDASRWGSSPSAKLPAGATVAATALFHPVRSALDTPQTLPQPRSWGHSPGTSTCPRAGACPGWLEGLSAGATRGCRQEAPWGLGRGSQRPNTQAHPHGQVHTHTCVHNTDITPRVCTDVSTHTHTHMQPTMLRHSDAHAWSHVHCTGVPLRTPHRHGKMHRNTTVGFALSTHTRLTHAPAHGL